MFNEGKKEMEVKRLENRSSKGYTTFGSMWEKGKLHGDNISFTLKGENGQVAVQSRVTAYWPDGSIKWAAHTADAEAMGKKAVIDPVLNQEINYGKGKIEVSDMGQDGFRIEAGSVSVLVCKDGDKLFKEALFKGKKYIESARCDALIENRKGEYNKEVHSYKGIVKNAEIVEEGDVRVVVKFSGIHISTENKEPQRLPFTIYMEIYRDCPEFRFTHTFFLDIDESKEFIKGVGISFDVPVSGEQYNRHFKALADNGAFSEAGAMLLCWHPRVSDEIYHKQIKGEKIVLDPESEEGRNAIDASKMMPVWDEYRLYQDSSEHFVIRKRTAKENVCLIDGLHGHRAPGVISFGSDEGSVMLGLKDFWQKYPSTLSVKNISKNMATGTIWLVTPDADAMDFRHYEDTGYSQTYYEGFDVFGASAYGIANTSEFAVRFNENVIPSDTELSDFCESIQKKALYIASPEYYHDLHAFGYWSLVRRDSEAENWLEDQLESAFEFYKDEVEVRKWYGMFDYGDFMHTYDKERHSWRYDMGGYAWQNTELVPTFWLWFYFLRTQREDVFTICEAMTRHCSEVDIYHFGKYQGLGSRHNVRHWGCPCKEPRIAMAGHNRMMYFLTGDFRLRDIFDEVKDADFSTIETDPLRFFFDKKEMIYPTHARTGPDWSSYVSNWLTQWEINKNNAYLDKIKTGIEDLKQTPLRLLSGTDFEYDPKTSHLRYIGDRATGGSHLSICQGSEQTWLELTDLLDDPKWNEMLAYYGTFYPLDNETQNKLSGGRIGNRSFAYPFMAAGVIAYGAYYNKDRELGKKVWEILKDSLKTELKDGAIKTVDVPLAGNQKVLKEIPWVSTNVFAQWCLNAIVALEFVRDDLPESFN